MKFFSSLLSSALVAGAAVFLGGCQTPVGPDDVVVKVNGDSILERQVIEEADNRINANKARDAARGLIFEESARDAMREFMRQESLNALIERELIIQQLGADRIEITDVEVDAYFLAKAKEFKQTPAQAEQQILEQGKTVRIVKERIRWNVLGVEKLYEAHAPEKKVLTEAEALKLYNDYPREFDREEQRRVSHILIAVGPDASEASKREARARAEAVLKRLQQGGDFAALAKEFSEDDLSKLRGGDRGWSRRGIITSPDDDPFGNVAFAMKKAGDLSDVVETRDGYHIILLTGIQEARQLSFEEVRGEMIADFRRREIGAFWETYGDHLREQARIEWTPAELNRRARVDRKQQELNRKIEAEIARQKELDQAATAGVKN
jgi:parvulin-like peptidyl-prolyl isomerase